MIRSRFHCIAGWICLLLILLLPIRCARKPLDSRHRPIAVSLIQIADDAVTEQARKGFIAELKEGNTPSSDAIHVDWASAHAQSLTIRPILSRLLQEKPDLLVTLGSPCLEKALALPDRIPVVFGVTVNPGVLGLNPEAKQEFSNFTGTYCESPLMELGRMIRRIGPSIGVLATLWNPSEPNSRYEMHAFREMCGAYGFQLREFRVRRGRDIPPALRLLLDSEPDAVVLLADHTTLQHLASFLPVLRKQNLPVFTDVPDIVGKEGADLGWGLDYREWGAATARIALQIFSGREPSAIPVREFKKHRLAVNATRLRKLGLKTPPDLLKKADVQL